MPTVVGVRFREAGKLYHFDVGGLTLHRLDRVVVETAGGLGIGRVVTEPLEKPVEELPAPVRRVLRRANAADVERQQKAGERGAAALDVCRRHARELALPLRLVDAECALDGTRVTITFTAEQRVDFRQLLRAASAELHCRIELRQVGARDEAKALDGIGPCGQRLCCSRWLTEFQPISIKMAKIQNLALNPGKLAGACGRLKCCLRYEIETYADAQRELPTLGTSVFTTDGEGRVVGLNLLERKVQVLFDEPVPRWLPADEVFRHNGCQEGMCEACTAASGAEKPSADAPPLGAAAPSPPAPAPRPAASRGAPRAHRRRRPDRDGRSRPEGR